MVSSAARRYLYELDNIEARARKKFGHCTHLYLYYVIREFMRYWRKLQKEHPSDLPDVVWGELYFFFNQALSEIASCRLDMMWLIYEYDDDQLFHEGYEPKPFWRTE